MKLKRKWGYSPRDKEPRAAITAVLETLADSSYDRGQIETPSSDMNTVQIFLAKLTAVLHARGVLLDEDVLALLPEFERADDAPAGEGDR